MADLSVLPPEPWGRRMTRAREDVACLRLQDAVDRLARCMFTSTGSISRLESLTKPPRDRRRRALAAALLYIYGLDPRPFRVGRDDLPPAIYAELAASSRLLVSNRNPFPDADTARYTQTRIAA